MRIARGANAMSFQTSRYKRFLSSGEVFNTAKTLRLTQGRRKADLPTLTTMGFNLSLRLKINLPSETTATARRKKGNLILACSAWTSLVFKGGTLYSCY